MVSQQAIASALGVSRSAVAGHIMNLSNKGIIKGRGYVVHDQPFVAAIGGANLDIHGKASGPLQLRDSNPGAVRMSPGGVARNIADNLTRLGVDCRLITAIGADQNGRLLLQQCRDAGIDTQHVQIIDSAPTSTYLSVLDTLGNMHVAINDMAITEQLGPDQLRNCLMVMKQAACVVVDTNLSESALAWLFNSLPGQPVFVDTVSAAKAERIKPYLGSVHTLKTSQLEAETLSGVTTQTTKGLRKIADWAHEQGVMRLFITLGSRGVFYSVDGQRAELEPVKKHQDVRNADGAGDAFLAGLVYAWLQEWPLERSLRFGRATADITLSTDATSNPGLSVAAVERAFEKRHAGQ